MNFLVSLSGAGVARRWLMLIIQILICGSILQVATLTARAQGTTELTQTSKAGFHFGPHFGYGQLSSESFDKNPPTLDAGFHLGYDWQLFPGVGVGLGSSVAYNYQLANGKDIGGTYSGLRLNPIQPRLAIFLGSAVLSYEHYLFSNFSITRKTADGESLEWAENTGFEVALALPFQVLGGDLTVYYSQNEYGSENLGGSKSELDELVQFAIVGFRITYRPFSSSLDMDYY